MPRMSKQKREEWDFFLGENGRIQTKKFHRTSESILYGQDQPALKRGSSATVVSEEQPVSCDEKDR